MLVRCPLQPQEFRVIPSHGRPAVGAYGTSITPGNNAYGSYTEVMAGSLVTSDAFGIHINVNSNAVTASARDTLVDIGVDPSGGTSWVSTIPDLLASCAAPYDQKGSGVDYFFWVFVPSGSSLAAKATVNNATVGTLRVNCRILTKPKHPELLRGLVGKYVRAFGTSVGSSSGTAVTPGQASDGAWTALGSALAEPLWYWQVGFGVNNATMTNLVYHADLGLGTGTDIREAILDNIITMTTVEELGQKSGLGGYCDGATGDTVFGRAQCSGAPISGISMAGYGVGGVGL